MSKTTIAVRNFVLLGGHWITQNYCNIDCYKVHEKKINHDNVLNVIPISNLF